MPVEKILIDTSKPKKIYIDTDEVKLIYVDDKCVYAAGRTITISKGTGVSSVSCAVTEKDGSTFTSTDSSVQVGYNAAVTYSAIASTGYNMNSYTDSETITASKTASFSATRKTFTVTISKGTGCESFSYTVTKWDGSTETGTTSPVTVEYGDSITVTGMASAAYNAPSSVTFSNITADESTTLTCSRKTYTVTISKGTGVSSFSYTITKWSGGTTTGTDSSVTVEYGDSITIDGVAASTEYNTPTSITYNNITSNETASLTTSLKTYTVTIYKGTGVQEVYYKVYNAAGYKVLDYHTAEEVEVEHGSTISIIEVSPADGYVIYNYQTYYKITEDTVITISAIQLYEVKISKGTGVSSYTYDVWDAAGTKIMTGYTSSPVHIEHGGKIKITSVTASTGYTANEPVSDEITITSDRTINILATANKYKVTIGSKLNGNAYSFANDEFRYMYHYEGDPESGVTHERTSAVTITESYGNTVTVYIKKLPGEYFSLQSVTYDGTSVSKFENNFVYDTYKITLNKTKDTEISINIIGKAVTTSIPTSAYFTVINNELERSAYTVTAKVKYRLNSIGKNEVICTIPDGYRPAQTKTFEANWQSEVTRYYPGNYTAEDVLSTATITINTDGTITSSKRSNGTSTSGDTTTYYSLWFETYWDVK